MELRHGLIYAINKFNFTLKQESFVYLDKPECIDSRDRFTDIPHMTCNDISKRKDCKNPIVRHECPAKCGECYQDSNGVFLSLGKQILTCKDISSLETKKRKHLCTNFGTRRFCPDTCSISMGPSFAPSILPSLDPSSIPSLEPTNPSSLPSLIPSTLPSSSPSSLLSSMPSQLPSEEPISYPSPSNNPSLQQSLVPSTGPSSKPSMKPSLESPSMPSSIPTTSHAKPSSTPSFSPSFTSLDPTISCEDDPSFRFNSNKGNSCKWVARKPELRCKKMDSSKGNKLVEIFCQRTCDYCAQSSIPSSTHSLEPSMGPSFALSESPSTNIHYSMLPSSTPIYVLSDLPSYTPTEYCSDDPEFEFQTYLGKKADCEYLGKNRDRKARICNKKLDGYAVLTKYICRKSCSFYLKACRTEYPSLTPNKASSSATSKKYLSFRHIWTKRQIAHL